MKSFCRLLINSHILLLGTQPTESPVTRTVIVPSSSTLTFTPTRLGPLPTNLAPDPPRLLQDSCPFNSGSQNLEECK